MIKYLIEALNYTNAERFRLINRTNSNNQMFEKMLEDPKLCFQLRAIGVDRLKFLLDKLDGNNARYIFIITRSLPIVKTINMIIDQNLNLLLESNDNEKYHEEMVNYLVKNPNAFIPIYSIEIEKLKLLFYSCTLPISPAMDILKSQNAIANAKILNIELKKLKIVFYLFDGPIISEILNDQNILDGIRNIDFKKFQHLLKYQSNDGCRFSMKLLENLNLVYAINTLDSKCFKSLLESCHLLDPLFVKIYKDRCLNEIQNFLFVFSNLPREITLLIIKRSRMLDLISAIYNEKLKFLSNYYYWLGVIERSAIYFYNGLDIEKIKVLICNGFMPLLELEGLYGIPGACTAINSIENKKLKLLVDSDNLTNVLLEYISLETIHKIDIEKLKILADHQYMMIGLLGDGIIDDSILSFDIERLRLLVESVENFPFDFNILFRLIENQYACNAIHSLDMDKYCFLLEGSYGINLLGFIIPNHEKILDFINLNSIKRLKQIFSMIELDELAEISKCYEGDVIRNLNFAMLLLKYGNINKITYDFVCNNKAVNEAIIKVFPDGFPTDQVLMKSKITFEGKISCLRDTCINVWMDRSSSDENKSIISIRY